MNANECAVVQIGMNSTVALPDAGGDLSARKFGSQFGAYLHQFRVRYEAIESALQQDDLQLGSSNHPGPESGGIGVEDKPFAAIENVPAASVHFIF